MHRHKAFFACGSSAPVIVEREGGTAAWLAGTYTASTAGIMGLSMSYFPACCSWQSEGLFGQSFSIAPPVQALRGLSCLGPFSVVQPVRHIEGPPGWSPIL